MGMFNLKAVEEEALEVNRRLNSYRLLRVQHRDRVLDLMGQATDEDELKELTRILMLTVRKEEEG